MQLLHIFPVAGNSWELYGKVRGNSMQLGSQAEHITVPCLYCAIKSVFRVQNKRGSMFVSHLHSPLPPPLLQEYPPNKSMQTSVHKQGMVQNAALCSSQIYPSALPCLPAIQPKHVKEILFSWHSALLYSLAHCRGSVFRNAQVSQNTSGTHCHLPSICKLTPDFFRHHLLADSSLLGPL